MDKDNPLPTLLFTEALKDSPNFRHQLNEHEEHIGKFETKLQEISRSVNVMVEFGQNYVAAFSQVTSMMNDMAKNLFQCDPLTSAALNAICDAYNEIVHMEKVVIEQAHWSIQKNLNEFLKCEVGKLHETRTHFDQLSTNLDDALSRKASVSRHRGAEMAEARNSLTAVGTCFAHTTLDYVAQINTLHAKKGHDVLDTFGSFLRTYRTFFDTGQQFFAEWSSVENGVVEESINALKIKSKTIERKQQDRHTLVPREVFQHPTGMPLDADVIMEGYLFKRASNAFKTWNRRWFQIRENKLLYSHRTGGSNREKPTVMESDLQLCLVRVAPSSVDRSCCFELVTPTKSHMLQADSEALCSAWMRALQRTIHDLHETGVSNQTDPDKYSFSSSVQLKPASTNKTRMDSASVQSIVSTDGVSAMVVMDDTQIEAANSLIKEDSTVVSGGFSSKLPKNSPTNNNDKKRADAVSRIEFLETLKRVAGNSKCADCSLDNPKWASINLGVVICIECCGIHRSLGVHQSKVRSLTMDTLNVQQRSIMLALGNQRVNAVYLRFLPKNDIVPPPATPNCSRKVRQLWIGAKYAEKRFVRGGKERALEVATARADHLILHSHHYPNYHQKSTAGAQMGKCKKKNS